MSLTVFERHDPLIKYLEQGSKVCVIYLNFTKAFDKVDHKFFQFASDAVSVKYYRYGIRSKLLTWILSFLTERAKIVSIDGSFSSQTVVVTRDPQGSVLDPLLFLMHTSRTFTHTPHYQNCILLLTPPSFNCNKIIILHACV